MEAGRLRTRLCSLVLMAVLIFSLSQQVSSIGGGTNRKLLQAAAGTSCENRCEYRCSLHSRPNLCKRACTTCCYRCNCVPPGTYGNREVCGKCYTDMKTHGNKNKCP